MTNESNDSSEQPPRHGEKAPRQLIPSQILEFLRRVILVCKFELMLKRSIEKVNIDLRYVSG